MVPPPARGWSRPAADERHRRPGSPACAGMVPHAGSPSPMPKWFPRLRGDGPGPGSVLTIAPRVPPPARGWSPVMVSPIPTVDGSPACAGMVPSLAACRWRRPGFPRLRGDGPGTGSMLSIVTLVPPPARGWSPTRGQFYATRCGSPACAGMVPGRKLVHRAFHRFPRLRGDGPARHHPGQLRQMVPPPARGWSHSRAALEASLRGSPACAGMVPRPGRCTISITGFPRLRGDGPGESSYDAAACEVPPPARGWSLVVRQCSSGLSGSPACAGMVPPPPPQSCAGRWFPRLRGDGQLPRRVLATLDQSIQTLSLFRTEPHNILLYGDLFHGHESAPSLRWGAIDSDVLLIVNDVID